MPAGTAQLNEDLRRALGKLERMLLKMAEHGAPAWAELLHGLPGMGGDEVFVVVMGPFGAVVSRTRAMGLKTSLRDLKLRLAGAEAAVLGASEPILASRSAQLAGSEASLLEDLGFLEQDPNEVGANERTRIDYELLLMDSLTLEQAGELLHLSTGRLRQRLGPGERTIFGFKDGRSWRIPRFQMDRRGRFVRGLDQVSPHLRPDAHPLAVARWFSSPHQDLVVGRAEVPVSPLAWLSAGRDPGAVAELIQEV